MWLALDEIIKNPSSMIQYKFIMRVIGAYGLIQVFAQDVGIPSGCDQARFMHKTYVQIIVFTSAAFAVTDDFLQSFLGTMLYFFLKYTLSSNVTNDVCFPTKIQIDKCGDDQT